MKTHAHQINKNWIGRRAHARVGFANARGRAGSLNPPLIAMAMFAGKTTMRVATVPHAAHDLHCGTSSAIPNPISMKPVVIEGRTIPHQILGRYGASKVIMKPCEAGRGIIASGPEIGRAHV